MKQSTNKMIAIALGGVVSLFSTPIFAADRACDDKQVYLAVMDSARKDLPAPYSGWDVKGAADDGAKIKTASGGDQCQIRLLFLNPDSDGKMTEVFAYYKTNVPLDKIRIKLDNSEEAKTEKKMCKQILFPKGSVSTAIDGVVPATLDKEGKEITDNNMPCYKITTAANQTAKIKVTSTSSNTTATVFNTNESFNDEGGGDDRDKFEFLTQKGTYQIDVYQGRSPNSDNYTLAVEVR